MKWIPLSERQKQKFADDPPVPVHPDVLITKLRPGQASTSPSSDTFSLAHARGFSAVFHILASTLQPTSGVLAAHS